MLLPNNNKSMFPILLAAAVLKKKKKLATWLHLLIELNYKEVSQADVKDEFKSASKLVKAFISLQ